jgi:ABC-type antimicrobial peptide transport system permease subunit
VFGVPILAGRGFSTADTLPGATAVIVDQTLAGTLSAGGQVVGRRIRYLQRRDDGNLGFGPWLEIVGVVPAFATSFTAPSPFGTPPPRFYHAAAPGGTDTTVVVVRVRGSDPRRFVERMRAVGTFVDPALKIQDLMSAAEVWNYEMQAPAIVVSVILAVTGSVLLLSAAGIYSMMSFTVTSRRREIGIRAALGADARRVLASIFARASAQLGAGVTLGLLAAAGLDAASGGGMLGGRGLVLLPGVVALMFTVGLLAALGPARRGLAVQPTDALREE